MQTFILAKYFAFYSYEDSVLFVDALFIFWKLFKGLHFSAACIRPSRAERCDFLSLVPVPALFPFPSIVLLFRGRIFGAFILVSSFLDPSYLVFLRIISVLLRSCRRRSRVRGGLVLPCICFTADAITTGCVISY